MITIEQYFGKWLDHPDATAERKQAATALLAAVSALESLAVADGVQFPINPLTGSGVSGEQYGGFRPQSCPQGAPESSHKVGRGIDLYDPHDAIDAWISDEVLAGCGLYREAPESTKHWCHLATRAPKSGKRTFLP